MKSTQWSCFDIIYRVVEANEKFKDMLNNCIVVRIRNQGKYCQWTIAFLNLWVNTTTFMQVISSTEMSVPLPMIMGFSFPNGYGGFILSPILQKSNWRRTLYQDKLRVNLGLIGPLVSHILILKIPNCYWQHHESVWCGLHCSFDCTISTFKYIFIGEKNFGSFGFQFSPLRRDLLTTI